MANSKPPVAGVNGATRQPTAELAAPPTIVTLRLPLLQAAVTVPRVSLIAGGRRDGTSAGSGWLANRSPTARKAALFTGLAALAVLDIVEWPVAVLLAATAAVAQRSGLVEISSDPKPVAKDAAPAARQAQPASSRGTR
ncbi:MAG: hypothetical protein ACYDB7_01885 [Mycobacteriales bacterium]